MKNLKNLIKSIFLNKTMSNENESESKDSKNDKKTKTKTTSTVRKADL